MPRFYVSQDLSPQQTFRLPENVVRHIQVLRLRVGENIVLFNGNGNAYIAHLQELGKREATCQIIDVAEQSAESPLHIQLVQAISSGERMDFTLQKRGIGREPHSAHCQRTLRGQTIWRTRRQACATLARNRDCRL